MADDPDEHYNAGEQTREADGRDTVAVYLRDCPVHGLIESPPRAAHGAVPLCPISITVGAVCGLELAAPVRYLRFDGGDRLVEAAERVCSEAEAHDEQWTAADYELYEPLRAALDAIPTRRAGW